MACGIAHDLLSATDRGDMMAGHICPWWMGYFLVSPLRRLWQNPRAILRPFISEGMVVLEPGCGMGFFTVEMARMVGSAGKVVAVDLQPRMIASLRRRAGRRGLDGRIETRIVEASGLNIDDLAGRVDFALAFAVVHELPDQGHFFHELYDALREGRKLLIAEPRGRVTEDQLAATVEQAVHVGFRVTQKPSIRSSCTVLLERC